MNVGYNLKLILILGIAYLGATAIYAQPKIIDFKDNENFYEIQKKFNKHWGNKKITSETPKQDRIGWKQYKRWEWFWEQRVYPSGDFPTSQHNLIELKKWQKKHKKNANKLQAVNSWTNLGPSTSAGGYAGLGRINWIEEDPNYNGSTNKTIWIGTPSGGMWKTTDDGATWQAKFEDHNSIGVSCIVINPSDSDVMWIATGDGEVGNSKSIGILKSTNGGDTWNTTDLNWNTSSLVTVRKIILHPTNRNILYVASSIGLYKSTNGGTNWSKLKDGSYKDIEFRPSTPDTLYACGTNIIKSTDAGANWANLSNGLPSSGISRIELAVSADNPNYLYALYGQSSDQGFMGLYRSTDGGNNFTARATSPNLLGWESSGSDTGGQAWYDLVLCASQTDADSIWAGGVNLWKSSNGGTDWSCVAHWYGQNGLPAVHADQHFLSFANGSYRLYAGNDGGIYRSTNSGTSWSWLGSGLKITQFYKLGVSKTNPSIVISGAQDNGTKLLKSDASWVDVIGGDGMECAIDPTNSNVMYGELYYADMKKSTNGGLNWSDVPIPTSEGGAWVSPFVIDQNNNTHIYLGLQNIWKSTDGGANWTQISSFTSGQLSFIALAPSNSNYIYVTTGANLLRTSDGGTSWSTMTKPGTTSLTSMAINPDDPNILWATVSGYNSGSQVYTSTNGGSSWTNITGSSFPAVPANTIVYQKNKSNRIYVGTDIGVYYIDDKLSTWQDFSSGLPTVQITELELHDSSNQIFASTYGRGVWKSEIEPSDIPKLLYPFNASTNISIDTAMMWSKITNATYGLQVSTNSDMSNPFINKTLLSDTSWTMNDSIFNKGATYYWRVNSTIAGETSDWSLVWSFKLVGIVPDVVLSKPNNNDTLIAIGDSIIWLKINNASYNLQVSKNSDFSNLIINATSLTDTSWVINDTLFDYHTQYYWRVAAKVDTNTGAWATAWNFTTALEYCEAKNSICDEYISKVSLDSISNSSTCSLTSSDYTNLRTTLKRNVDYEILVNNSVPYMGDSVAIWIDWNRNKSFDASERYSTTTSNYSVFNGIITVPVGVAEGKYTMRVRLVYTPSNALAPCGLVTYGETEDYSIYFYKTPLDTPTLTNPSNNATNRELEISLGWNAVQYIDYYELIVSKSINFSDTLLHTTTTQANYDLTNLNLFTDYYWKVRAINTDTSSLWSNTFTFKTKNLVPELSSPINNSINQIENIALKWKNISADYYQLVLSKSSDMSSPIMSASTSDTSLVVSLNNNVKYYWRIRAFAASDSSDWSPVWAFTTKDSIVVPTLLSVANNSTNQVLNIDLSWHSVASSSGYSFQLSLDDSFASIAYEFALSDTTINTLGMNLLHSQ
ncbi:MAG TPA: GEVED domain-containing protein, partial [Candidatus Kapabacteria bacterium]|nr:GEVED domain-containing protein [Candidatus Kapabacteria bacterium]